jgi:hypothetical protein
MRSPLETHRTPSRSVLLAFVLTATEAILIACQESGFLGVNPASEGPLAAAAGAAMSAAVGFVLRRISGGNPSRWTRGTFVACGAVVGATALARATSPGAQFAQYAVYDAVLLLLSATAWTAIQAPLDAARARQILPRVTFAACAGGLVGGAVAWAAAPLGGNALVVLVPIGCLACAAIGADAASSSDAGPASTLDLEPASRTGAIGPVSSRLIPSGVLPPVSSGMRPQVSSRPVPSRRWRPDRMIIALAVLFVVLRLVVDFEFKQSLQQRENQLGILRSLGGIDAVASLLSLVAASFAAPRLVQPSRLTLGLVLLPGLLGTVLVGFGALPAFPLILVGFVARNAWQPAVQNAAEGCLIGSVAPSRRRRLLILLEGIVAPLAFGIGAAVLAIAVPTGFGWLVLPTGIAAALAYVAIAARAASSGSHAGDLRRRSA